VKDEFENMTKKITGKGVIFDLDGVLVDTGEFHRQSWYDLAEREGVVMSDELFYSTFGMQNYQIMPQLLGRPVDKAEMSRLSLWKEQRYRELIDGKLTLMAGVRDLIIQLKQSGFSLAIGTSTPRTNLDFMLRATGIGDYFDDYVVGEEVKNSKPAPDTFAKAAVKLNLPPQNCVVIEDAVQGVQAGKAAGMAVIAVTTTRSREDLSQADMIVDSLAELVVDDFVKLLNLAD
jgi:beta-phosphoglucomutase family hydrolase